MKEHLPLLYFAYGSNMHPRRMAERVKNAELVGVGSLSGHALRFHKRGQDGSGKCNALFTGDGRNAINGVVYAVDREGRRNLDIAEGGYRARDVCVLIKDSRSTCFTYTAEPGMIDGSLRPFAWYKQYVLDGGAHHGLPATYMQAISDIQTVSDPDEVRHAMHLSCLHYQHAVSQESVRLVPSK